MVARIQWITRKKSLAFVSHRLMSKQTLVSASLLLFVFGALAFAIFAPTGGRRNASDSEQSSSEDAKSAETNSSNSGDEKPIIVEEPAPTPDGMVWIPGGTFVMGNSKGAPDKHPDYVEAIPEHHDAMGAVEGQRRPARRSDGCAVAGDARSAQRSCPKEGRPGDENLINPPVSRSFRRSFAGMAVRRTAGALFLPQFML